MKVFSKKKMSLPTQIFLAMVAGSVLGILIGEKATKIEFIGNMWLNMIKMFIVPVVVTLVIKGVSSVEDPKTLGRIGSKIFILYVATTVVASFIGIGVGKVFRPGIGFNFSMETEQLEAAEFPGVEDFFTSLISKNMFQSFSEGNMMQVLIISLLIGIALVCMHNEASKAIIQWTVNMSEVFMYIIGMVMKLAPIGVFCLMASAMGSYGISLISHILKLLGTFYLGCFLHIFCIYLLAVWIISGINPISFIKRTSESWLTAMSTCSATATVPVTLKVAEEKLGIDEKLCSFSIPLGSTINSDGGAILSGVVMLFCAQAMGMDMTLGQIFNCIILTTAVCTGSTGLPGGGIMRLIVVATAMNLPLEMIAIVSAFYRFFDMGTSSLNVLGDLSVSTVVDRWEKKREKKIKDKTEQVRL